jgi:perosamine synthetase
MKIPLSKPDIGKREIELVTRVLRSGQLSLGPVLAEFEQKFASYVGTRYAVATSSGTSALHLAVEALGIGPGDEVLTTSFSFVASANCLFYAGAVPAFVDIDPFTLNLDPRLLRDAITRHYIWEGGKSRLVNRQSGRVLKAILPVHVFGLPCDMDPILELAEVFNLKIIEDACEALGAEHTGIRAGTFGDAAAFAFYPNKQMTTGEGGMLVTNNSEIARVCCSLRNQGRDEDAAWLRHIRLGYNYRLSDLHCALGLAQLERIDELLASRARVAAAYSRGLAGIPQVSLPCEVRGSVRSWFVYVIQLRGTDGPALRERLLQGLRESGIACQAYFPAIHRQPYFQNTCLAPQHALPFTVSASERCLALPFFPSMTGEQVDAVCASLREILAQTVESDTLGRAHYAAPARAAG